MECNRAYCVHLGLFWVYFGAHHAILLEVRLLINKESDAFKNVVGEDLEVIEVLVMVSNID